MAMPKARVILKVERGEYPARVIVTVREHDYRTTQTTLEELTGAELMRAAANVGLSGGPGVERVAREDAIKARVWQDGFTPREFHPVRHGGSDTPRPTPEPQHETPEPQHEEEDRRGWDVDPLPTPRVDTTTEDGSDIDAAVEAFRDALTRAKVEPAAVEVDEGMVRGIVADAVASAVDEIRDTLPVRQIQLPEHDVTDLPALHHEGLPALIQKVGLCLRAHEAGATIQYPYLTGPAGSGKSTLARHAAEAHGLGYREMSLSPDMLRSALFGFIDAGGTYHSTPLREAYEEGHLLVLDEMDNGNAGILAGLNQLLANGGCSFPDGYVKRHPRFVAIGTGNTFGLGPDAQYVGRNRLDAATLNRFVTEYVAYDLKLERSLALGWATDETRDAVAEWIDTARRYRRNAEEANLAIVLSPRDVVTGAAYVSAGMTVAEAAESVIFAPMTADTRSKVEGA
jgi:AAA domain (dynein-related subfamily)/CbbQ/NirQ/NorQ C-terminal